MAEKAAANRYRHIDFLPEAVVRPPAAVRSESALHRGNPRCCKACGGDSEPLVPQTRQFLRWLLGQAALDESCYRETTLGRRLQACLRSLHACSIAEARQRLKREPHRLSAAISTLLIGVTQFFREQSVFSCLETEVLPKLSAGRSGLCVWSAGCSDGAELYSVAMLLARSGLLEGSVLVGTDCRADAIDRARRGWFEADRLQPLESELREAYFSANGRGWQMCETLRRATVWRQGNVLAGPPDDKRDWDLILCRNLAIYLEPVSAGRLWKGLAGSLRTGGVLVAGKAEQPQRHLPLVRLAPCVFEKRG